MCLRKSPRLSPELLAAKRRNARRSTGPSTPAEKQNSKMNALKHGAHAAEENHRQVRLALGEDPEEFEALKQQLMTAYGPGDALWEAQIDDLAQPYILGICSASAAAFAVASFASGIFANPPR
jgi:hypothetical protein